MDCQFRRTLVTHVEKKKKEEEEEERKKEKYYEYALVIFFRALLVKLLNFPTIFAVEYWTHKRIEMQ